MIVGHFSYSLVVCKLFWKNILLSCLPPHTSWDKTHLIFLHSSLTSFFLFPVTDFLLFKCYLVNILLLSWFKVYVQYLDIELCYSERNYIKFWNPFLTFFFSRVSVSSMSKSNVEIYSWVFFFSASYLTFHF